MSKSTPQWASVVAIGTLAEIKSAMESFDRGEANVFDVLETIAVEIAMFRAAIDERAPRRAA